MPTPKGRLTGDQLRDVQQASYLLHRMAERQQAYYAACATDFGMSAAQAKAMVSLEPGEAVPMRTLANRLGSDPSNLTGLVDKLESRGLVRRTAGSPDRRVKTLELTTAGERLRSEFWERLTHAAGPIEGLTPAQVRQLSVLLQAALDESPD